MLSLYEYCTIFIDGEEGAGLYAYALAPSHRIDDLRAWNVDHRMGVTRSISSWPYLGAAIGSMTVAIETEPVELKELLGLLDDLFSSARRLGALVVWLGGEDSSWNPDVLKPGMRSGNVLAVMSESLGLQCAMTSDADVRFVDESDLARLWPSVEELLERTPP